MKHLSVIISMLLMSACATTTRSSENFFVDKLEVWNRYDCTIACKESFKKLIYAEFSGKGVMDEFEKYKPQNQTYTFRFESKIVEWYELLCVQGNHVIPLQANYQSYIENVDDCEVGMIFYFEDIESSSNAGISEPIIEVEWVNMLSKGKIFRVTFDSSFNFDSVEWKKRDYLYFGSEKAGVLE